MNNRVLIFGAGLVTGPLVDHLIEAGATVTVASRTPEKGERITRGRPGTKVVPFDITKHADHVDGLLSNADLAVSMLPYVHHVTVAERCIAMRTPLVTTSYVSDAMRALDAAAREAGVLLLNECGLDPGIDHMSAMQVIDDVREAGGLVEAFSSYCGGLPAPEANTNPLGYKFSWSPRGVLLASRNSALYLDDCKEVSIPGPELFSNSVEVSIPGIATFEGYPNRNSLPYIDTYGITKARGMFRGTLRNLGWCESMMAFARLGLLDDTSSRWTGKRYRDLTLRKIGDTSEPAAAVARFLGVAEDSHPVAVLRWLGLLSDEPLPERDSAPLDLLVDVMLDKMAYEPGERDMVILRHEFLAVFPDRRERITATLVAYGESNGRSAMSRTVGLPAALACRLILDGEVSDAGVQIPVSKQWYDPILRGLAEQGIRFVESRAPA